MATRTKATSVTGESAIPKVSAVELKPLRERVLRVDIVGTADLIIHAFEEKSKQQIRDKQFGKSKGPKAVKDPKACVEGALYRDEDGDPAMPARNFKAAIVHALRLHDGIPMTVGKVAIRVLGDWVKIRGKLSQREDFARNANGNVDLRYRPVIKAPWKATLSIWFLADVLSPEQIVNLVNTAGYGGMGDWRPSSPKSVSGTFGTFKVETSTEAREEVA